jgi:hypothetical protein
VHLKRTIRHRTWLEIRHGRRISFVPLPDTAANDEAAPQMEQALAYSPPTTCRPTALQELAATVCQQLRRLVERDHDAIAVVACWEDGVIEPDEIVQIDDN